MAASNTRSYTIAAEAAAEIVWQKLEILLSHPVCVGRLSMETRTKVAQRKVAAVKEFLSTQCRPSNTTEWLGQVLRAMYYAEEFIDIFHLREACKRHKALHVAARPLAKLASKYMLWRDLSNLVSDMEKLCRDKFLTGKKEAGAKRKKEPASSSSHASVLWQGKKLVGLTSFLDRQASSNYICRKDVRNKIRKWIRERTEQSIQGISIWGEQGVGKTFLARWVCREAMHLGFEWRAWVQVLASMDKREFLFEILKQVEKVPKKVKDLSFDEITTMLGRKLTETKGFLIVLDDVHQSDQRLLEGLMMSIPFSAPGVIITTTQDDKIAGIMAWGTDPINLTNLGDEESQEMLAGKLHRLPHVQRLTEEENNILKRCCGLPLRISLLGGLLSNAGEHERALLQDISMMTFELEVLQLSCDWLPLHLKPCFIYIALFPVASVIPTRRLVRLWLAEGLLDAHCYDVETKRISPPEKVGETFILELADRNVIDVVSWRADGSPKACQMLTSLYDLILPTAMNTGFLQVLNASKSKDGNNLNPTSQQQQLPAQLQERTNIRWLAVTEECDSSYPDLNLDHVRSLLSFAKDIRMFLRMMTSKTDYSLLRVLDLEGVYKPSLQGVFRKLVLLKYLGLRSTVLDWIPSEVADLHYLETLDIKHTNITYLPSSLWKAKNLRHLHLNWFYIDLKKILKVCGDNVMALTKLQTLSGLVIGEVKENSMTGLMNSFTALTTLKLFLQHSDNHTSGSAGETVARWICSRLTNLQSLTFGLIQEEEPPKVAQPANEAEPTEEASKVAKSAEEAKPEEEPPKVAQPAKEAEPTKVAEPAEEAEPTKEASKVAKSAEEAKPAKEAEPPISLGPLPELAFTQHHELFELHLLGQLNKPIWIRLLPVSLRVLTLSGSKVETDVMPTLGNLLSNLRTLRLLANSFQSESMRFVTGGFLSLKILKIWKLPQLVRVNIEPGAMPRLQELELRHLKSLKTVEGMEKCKELETICVAVEKGARSLLDHLEEGKGETTNLYKIERD